jgi:hypothetical protein
VPQRLVILTKRRANKVENRSRVESRNRERQARDIQTGSKGDVKKRCLVFLAEALVLVLRLLPLSLHLRGFRHDSKCEVQVGTQPSDGSGNLLLGFHGTLYQFSVRDGAESADVIFLRCP